MALRLSPRFRSQLTLSLNRAMNSMSKCGMPGIMGTTDHTATIGRLPVAMILEQAQIRIA
jgi:hypothetical protein